MKMFLFILCCFATSAFADKICEISPVTGHVDYSKCIESSGDTYYQVSPETGRLRYDKPGITTLTNGRVCETFPGRKDINYSKCYDR